MGPCTRSNGATPGAVIEKRDQKSGERARGLGLCRLDGVECAGNFCGSSHRAPHLQNAAPQEFLFSRTLAGSPIRPPCTRPSNPLSPPPPSPSNIASSPRTSRWPHIPHTHHATTPRRSPRGAPAADSGQSTRRTGSETRAAPQPLPRGRGAGPPGTAPQGPGAGPGRLWPDPRARPPPEVRSRPDLGKVQLSLRFAWRAHVVSPNYFLRGETEAGREGEPELGPQRVQRL